MIDCNFVFLLTKSLSVNKQVIGQYYISRIKIFTATWNEHMNDFGYISKIRVLTKVKFNKL